VRRKRDQRGASAVEFALVLPFLCLVLFGMITTGFTYNDHLSVSNAVREGARFGSSLDYTQSSWATSVRDRVKDVYFNDGATLTDAQICVSIVNAAGSAPTGSNSWAGSDCGAAPASPSSMAAGSCVVKVWVRKPADIKLLIFPTLDFNIGAKSVSYYGRTVSGCTAS